MKFQYILLLFPQGLQSTLIISLILKSEQLTRTFKFLFIIYGANLLALVNSKLIKPIQLEPDNLRYSLFFSPDMSSRNDNVCLSVCLFVRPSEAKLSNAFSLSVPVSLCLSLSLSVSTSAYQPSHESELSQYFVLFTRS